MQTTEFYLGYLQATISRLSGQSFFLKGWSVTIVSALLATAGALKLGALCIVAVLPTLILWALDAYYLALERRFRALFVEYLVSEPTDKLRPELFDPGKHAGGQTIIGSALSISVWPFHVAILASALAAYALVVSNSPA